ncbi:MAG: TolC family protein [Candidatus Brocadiales bacterium]
MRYSVILFLLLLVQSSSAEPKTSVQSTRLNQQQKTLTLDTAIQITLEKNPQLASMRKNIEAAEGRIKQARLIPNPRFQLNAEEVPTNRANGIDPGRGQNTLSVSQLFETGGKRRLRTEAAKKEKTVVELEYETLALNIVGKTKRAFYEVLAAKEGLKITKETLAIAGNLENAARKRLEAGDIPQIEVFKAELEAAQSANNMINAEVELLNAQKRLFTVMGEPDVQPGELVGSLYTETPALDLDKLQIDLLQNYPLLKARKQDIELANTVVKQAKREVIPNLDISAGYGRDGDDGEDIARLAIEVPFPIFNRNQGKIAESRALVGKAERDYRTLYNNLLLQLNQTFSTYSAQGKQVKVFIEEILPRAEQSLNLAVEGYKEGEFNYLDVLDAQRTLAQVRASYISTLKGLNVTIAELEKLICRKITELPVNN